MGLLATILYYPSLMRLRLVSPARHVSTPRSHVPSRVCTRVAVSSMQNSDAGTMSPFEHGEVFVLNDGGEVSAASQFAGVAALHCALHFRRR